jgi:beta-glucanase (GH16 family)
MEHVGYDQNKVHITVHTGAFNHSINTQKGMFKIIPTASTEFHKYRVDWTPVTIKGYIDDDLVFDFSNNGEGFKAWPFDKKFHLLLNIAVGGNWGGAKGVDPEVFPASMEVDYVRVYKLIKK